MSKHVERKGPSPIRIYKVATVVEKAGPPTDDQLKKIRRIVTSRGLEMPDIKTAGEADRYLRSRNMFVTPHIAADGYSENSYIGRHGAEARWGRR